MTLAALLLSLFGVSDDPIRACYTWHDNQPWSCYLLADVPQGHAPVFVGPESMIMEATR